MATTQKHVADLNSGDVIASDFFIGQTLTVKSAATVETRDQNHHRVQHTRISYAGGHSEDFAPDAVVRIVG